MTDAPFDEAWISEFAASMQLGVPDAAQIEALLDLAGRAAHASGDRRNAPLACFLAGRRLGSDATADADLAAALTRL